MPKIPTGRHPFMIIALLLTASFGLYAQSALDQRIDNLNQVSISNARISKDIQQGHFDKIFLLYRYLGDEKKNMSHFSAIKDTQPIISKLSTAQDKIIDYAYASIKDNTDRVIPAQQSDFVPNGLIVLGTTPGKGILESRLDQAYKLAVKYPHIPIILSGKGLKNGLVEADYMHDYLRAYGVDPTRLYKETVSLDTVGNAAFSYLVIAGEPRLNKRRNWLVITSNFHAMRALYNFAHIFPKPYRISVFLSPLLSERPRPQAQTLSLRSLVNNEIDSQSNGQFIELLQRQGYDQKSAEVTTQDISQKPCAILNELLLKHGLYKEDSIKNHPLFAPCDLAP